jgi:pimeloyl-ACP methyl ester carboxylesterase
VQIVLLPGFEGSPSVWAPTRAGLGPLSVCAPRLPAGEGLVVQARALAAALGPGPRLVVGASYGGLLGWALADLLQDDVRGLILIGSLDRPEAAPAWMGPAARVIGALPSGPRAALGGAWRARLRRSLGEDCGDAALIAQIVAEADGWEALPSRLGAIRAWGLSARPPCPTLCLAGQGSGAPLAGAGAGRAGVERRRLPGGPRPHLRGPEGLAPLLRAAVEALRCGSRPW